MAEHIHGKDKVNGSIPFEGFPPVVFPDCFEANNSLWTQAKYAASKGSVMAAKKQNVEIIALACTECKRRNYTTTKNRKTQQEKLELMKFCKWDRKHTLHKETKVK